MSIIDEVYAAYGYVKGVSGCEPFFTGAYGSMNYTGLFVAGVSDIDTKTLLLPNTKMLILGEMAPNTEYPVQFGDSTPALATVKDVREYFKVLLKLNPAFIEPVFSKWVAINPKYFAELDLLRRHLRHFLAANPYNLYRATLGMIEQKYHALEHHYESKAEVLAEYGYDPKQLVHIVRLYYFLLKFASSGDFETALKFRSELACSIKSNPPSLEKAREFANFYRDTAATLVYEQCAANPQNKEIAKEFKEQLDALSVRLIAKHLNLEV